MRTWTAHCCNAILALAIDSRLYRLTRNASVDMHCKSSLKLCICEGMRGDESGKSSREHSSGLWFLVVFANSGVLGVRRKRQAKAGQDDTGWDQLSWAGLSKASAGPLSRKMTTACSPTSVNARYCEALWLGSSCQQLGEEGAGICSTCQVPTIELESTHQ